MDLYFRVDQNVEFLATGENEIHLTGYFEPTEEDSELDDSEIQEEEESVEVETAKPKHKESVGS